ncbi:MAG TPA: STAS domain-containing protein [Candidatus Acidoferrales bacterium]
MANDTLIVVATDGDRKGQKILTLTGSLNIHSVFAFQAATREETAEQVILDFTGVPFMDSAGLGSLVGAYVAAQRTHRKLAVAGANTQVKTLIDMTQVGTLVKCYENVALAQAALGPTRESELENWRKTSPPS